MAKPIYKFFVVRPTAAWYELSQEERNGLFAKGQKALEKVGGKGVIYCNSSWSSEAWPMCGVEEFPDIEAVQKLAEIHVEMDWHRYLVAETVLGTEWEA
jgi:hypothetical protein